MSSHPKAARGSIAMPLRATLPFFFARGFAAAALMLFGSLLLAGCAGNGGGAGAGGSHNPDGTASAATGQMSSGAADADSSAPASAGTEYANESGDETGEEKAMASDFTIRVGAAMLEVSAADTDAARELAERLRDGEVQVSLRAYGGFEKVGPLPWALPRNDAERTTAPGDVMLYQGDQIVIFLDSHSWEYTPLGTIEGATGESLAEALGSGDVEVKLALP